MEIFETFNEVFKRTPQVIAASPGRVNLIGEHIDYSGGLVLPFAIEQRSLVAMCKRRDRRINIASVQGRRLYSTSLDDLKLGEPGGWERYPLGAIWALGLEGGIETGVDLLIDSRVPIGAGLSSSAALECSVATGLNEMFSLAYDQEYLSHLAQKAENDFVGVPCGIMDQSISLMAREGHALLLDCRNYSSRHIRLEFSRTGMEILIIDTRAHHSLMDGEYAKRRESCESVSIKLNLASLRDLTLEELERSRHLLTPVEFRRARHAVTEMERVLSAVAALEANDNKLLGQLLSYSHGSLRDDYEVSCQELNLAVDSACEAGALGARMVGGGFGGSAIALIPAGRAEEVRERILANFARNKFRDPQFHRAVPSVGAQVISA